MKEFYIRIETYATPNPHIVDEEQMYQAERGMNYLNPDEFMFLCEADNLHEAHEFAMEEFSTAANDAFAERLHP